MAAGAGPDEEQIPAAPSFPQTSPTPVRFTGTARRTNLGSEIETHRDPLCLPAATDLALAARRARASAVKVSAWPLRATSTA